MSIIINSNYFLNCVFFRKLRPILLKNREFLIFMSELVQKFLIERLKFNRKEIIKD